MENRTLKLFVFLPGYLLLILFLFSCSAGSKLTKITGEGDTALENGNYAKALRNYEEVITSYRENDDAAGCPVYGKAGRAALKLGDTAKGTDYLELAEFYGTASATDLAILAETYREMDNLSKEIEALEALTSRFPDNEIAEKMIGRLFETYIESENWQPAVDLWPELDESARVDPVRMEAYFIANRELGRLEVCDELAPKILTRYPESIPVLEYLGEKFYNKAENRYQDEMEAYENNRTNRQYAQLLKAFETVTEDFKKSLGYFKRLYELDPSPRYASYLANIYARLDEKEKSEYYKSKAM